MSPAPRRTLRATALAAVVVTAVSVLSVAALPAVAATPGSAPSVAAAAAAADPTSIYALARGQQLVPLGSSSTQPSILRAGSLPSGPAGTINSGNGTALILQGDGNLVEYETTTSAVLFTTNTTSGARLVYQDDGNIVLYDKQNNALWNTGTAGDTQGQTFASYGNGQLIIQSATNTIVKTFGPAMTPGPGVMVGGARSPNGYYSLIVQGDGNVVAYTANGRAIWMTGTWGGGRSRLVAQADGNLVLYQASTGRPLWSSGTWGAAGGVPTYYQLDMQDDGNVVLYLTNGRSRLRWVWQSGTSGVA